MPETIGKRYVIAEPLGSGGMGTVYRARDRLALTDVALKRVHIPPEDIVLPSKSTNSNFELALAREFRILSTLRHPNIIRVLDYGFDEQRRPYYTMDLLDGARDLIQVGSLAPPEKRIGYLIQVLEALGYLHRRGVLHRDLKPANLLVSNGNLKALDFGLSAALAGDEPNLSTTMGGTLLYLAPEMLRGESAGIASDLYAVGVIAYELLAGRHPFENDNPAQFMSDVLTAETDLELMDIGAPVRGVVARLLARIPEDRYVDAFDALDALTRAAELPARGESTEVRESFLRAASFVGRKRELEILQTALANAKNGRGGIVLVGGESGVGKSRLMQEFRSLALVEGAFAVEGQAIDTGRSAFHIWRNVLRELALIADVTAEQAGVLKQLVPDIDRVTTTHSTDPPKLEARKSRRRLLESMEQVFFQQGTGVVIVLEDMQWIGDDSLQLLQRLQKGLASSSVLVIGTYRSDEFQSLPDLLPSAQVLRLGRLDHDDISDLSRSMLGRVGESEAVLKFLDQETEGNPFFLVEVVRTLAEESGRLSEIDQGLLPEAVFPTGIQEIVSRRIAKVPEYAIKSLRYAAVAGRQVDEKLLAELSPTLEVDRWLQTCGDAAVMEASGDSWQFAHDKLRGGVVSAIPAAEAPDVYREVAEMIESLYPEAPEHAARLADLWTEAGDEHKQLHYLMAAGDHARFQFAFSDANRSYEIARDLLIERGDMARVARVWMQMGQSYENAFQFELAQEAYHEGFQLLQQPSAATGEELDMQRAPHALRIGWADPLSLDPIDGHEIVTMLVIGQLYEGLGRLTNAYDLVPAVAESWDPLDGGRKYRFYLKPGLKWSDGHSLTSHDFVLSIKRLLNLRPSSEISPRWKNIKGFESYKQSAKKDPDRIGVRALDDRTLEIELKKPSAGSLEEFATLRPVPKHIVELDPVNWAKTEQIACNGPYMPVRWERDQILELARNPHYGGERAGNIENVEIQTGRWMGDWKPFEQYENDATDVEPIWAIYGNQRVVAQERFAADIVRDDPSVTSTVAFDCSRPPFNDARIRRAFTIAIDKQKYIVETESWGFPASGGYIPPGIPGHSPNIGLGLDIDGAKGLLEAADAYRDFANRRILFRGWDGGQGECRFLRDSWKKHLGIEVEIEFLDWHEYLESLKTHPPHICTFTAGGNNALDTLEVFRSREWGAGRGWKNPAFEHAFDSASIESDPALRLQHIQEADRILIEDGPVLPLTYWPLVYLVKPWVRALPSSPVEFWALKDAIIDPH